jgi:hypothetical protein
VIRIFTKQLQSEEKNFRKVWDAHVGAEEHGGMYHYSSRMGDMIEEDLQSKLDDLDFDKDPYQIVGDLVDALQKFDQVSNRATLNVVKPKLEQWIQVKLVSLREMIGRAITFETWTPIGELQQHSESVVNVFFTLVETLENLYDFLGKDIFLRWSKCLHSLIHDVIYEYCEHLMKGIDNVAQFKPSEVLPPMNVGMRKGKKPKEWGPSLFT